MRRHGVSLNEARAVAHLMVSEGMPARRAFKKVGILNEGSNVCGQCGAPTHTEVHVVDDTGNDRLDYATVWVHDDSTLPDHDASPSWLHGR